jgi:hypothetical protein
MPAPTIIIDQVETSGVGLVLGSGGKSIVGFANGNSGAVPPPTPGALMVFAAKPDDVSGARSSRTSKEDGASPGRSSPSAIGVSAVHGTAGLLAVAAAAGAATRCTAGRGFIAARTFCAAGTITAPVEPAQTHMRSFAAAGVTIVNPGKR